MRPAAQFISALFNPFLEIPLLFMVILGLALQSGYSDSFLWMMIFLQLGIPGTYFLISWYKRHRKDWDIHLREMRLPLFAVVTVSHGLAVLLAEIQNKHPLAEIILGLWVLVVIFALITFYWKISIHTGVNATLVVMYQLLFEPIWGLWVIVGAVAWARVIDKDHSSLQAIAGVIVPVIMLPLLYRLWGVI